MNTLSNTTLSVAIENSLPYCGFKNMKNVDIPFSDLVSSIEIELLKLLISRYGFQVNLKNIAFDFDKKVNQTWESAKIKVSNGTFNLSICSNALSRDGYFEVVRFTKPFIFDELTFMSLVPDHRPRTWIIFEPFYLKLWLSILVAWFVCSIFLGSLNILRLFAVLIKQSVELNKIRIRNETIFIGWLLACLVLSNSYIGVFHSILTFPDYEKSIETKEDLAKYLQLGDSFTRLIFDRNYFVDIRELKEDQHDLYSLIRSYEKRTKFSMAYSILKVVQAFQDKQSKQVIFIDFRLFLMWFRRNNEELDKQLFIPKDRLRTVSMGWILPPNSPLLDPFNRIIVRVSEMGIIQYWTDKTFRTFPAKDRSLAYDRTSFEKEANFRAFNLEDFQSIFMIWLLGVVSSILYFALEILNFFLKKKL